MPRTDDTAPATKADLERLLAAIEERFDGNAKRFDAIDTRFDTIDARFERIDVRLDQIESRLDKHEEMLKALNAQFHIVFEHVERVERSLRQHIDQAVETLKDEMFSLRIDHGMRLDRYEKRLRTCERRLGIVA